MTKTCYYGYRRVKYVNKAGKEVEGYYLYFTEEAPDVVGESCFSAWVSVDVFMNYFKDIPISTHVELCYNRYGSLCGCRIII